MQIMTDEDYRKALHEVELLIGRAPILDTPDSDRLIALSIIVEEWEDQRLGPHSGCPKR